MSQVTLQGNASGTGIFTVAAPNSNTNRTLTLPDATGTVVTTDATQTLTNKSISGAQIDSGTVAVARLGSGTPSASNFLRGDGSWQAVSGGVTSLNGQTGAITNTALDAIGSYVIAYDGAGNTARAAGSTQAGSSLRKKNGDRIGNNMDGNSSSGFAYTDASVVTISATGTWRAMGQAAPSDLPGFGTYFMANLWVRIS
jgi:hypothetical protein